MRFCWPQWIFIILVVFLGVGAMLSSCGNKGPLFIPVTGPEAVKKIAEDSTAETPAIVEKQKKKQE